MNKSSHRLTTGLSIATDIALVHLLLRVLTNGNYGVFRDEFYYLDCSRHLAWGYVDHPPLSIWLLAAVRAVFGESVHALRVLSELAGAAVIDDALPEQDKPATLIVGSNYGEAGAINYYGPALGLPSAVSTHNNHYLWGPGPVKPEVVIRIGGRREQLGELFEHVTHVATVTSTYAMPYESNLPIFVLRGLKIPLEEAWRAGKNFHWPTWRSI